MCAPGLRWWRNVSPRHARFHTPPERQVLLLGSKTSDKTSVLNPQKRQDAAAQLKHQNYCPQVAKREHKTVGFPLHAPGLRWRRRASMSVSPRHASGFYSAQTSGQKTPVLNPEKRQVAAAQLKYPSTTPAHKLPRQNTKRSDSPCALHV